MARVPVPGQPDLGAGRKTDPRDLIVVNTREAWTLAGPRPVHQQRWRTRWIQVWRAGEWRALPAQQLPLQPTAGQLRYQPR